MNEKVDLWGDTKLLPNGRLVGHPGVHGHATMEPEWVNWSAENPFDCDEQELKLIESFMSGSSKAQAARDAGYTGKFPTRWARDVMRRENVQNEMKRQSTGQSKDIMYDPNKVLHGLVMIAEANMVDAFVASTRGKIKLANLANLPVSLKYAIKSIKFSQHGMCTIELHDKLRALTKLGEFFNMWGPESSRGGAGAAGAGGQVLEEQIVFEKRMNEIGEVISGRIDRVIRRFDDRNDPPTIEQSVD